MTRRPTLLLSLVLLALVPLVTACPKSATQMAIDKTVRPAWIPSPNRKHPEYVYVTGACRGLDRRFLARRCAILDAQVRLRRQTKNHSVKVRGSNIEDEHFERRRVEPGSSKLAYDWWVLVALPRSTLRPAPPGPGSGAQLSPDERTLIARWRALTPEARQALSTLLEQLAGQPEKSPATEKRERLKEGLKSLIDR